MVVAAITLDGSLPEPPPTAFASEFRQPDELGESSPPCSAARAALWEAGRKLDAAYLGRPAVELDPAMLEQLRELGYVE
mgnify:FL=1